MHLTGSGLLLIYFIYGLAFFGLGLALLLETRRSPSITLNRRLVPLSVFGLLHGSHEWLEFFILQERQLGELDFAFIYWIRLFLLVMSFTSLLAYSIQELQPAFGVQLSDPLVGLIIILIYGLLLRVGTQGHIVTNDGWFTYADALARILIAVPAAFLGFLTLRKRAGVTGAEGRKGLAKYLRLASFGFLYYTFTQSVVPEADVLYASWFNARVFGEMAGVPIQLFRTIAAVLIAYPLIRATQVVETERQEELDLAQQAQLRALQSAQHEMQERQKIERRLLRNIVAAQEEERKRISRELHDETAQLLTAIGYELASVQAELGVHSKLESKITRIQALCREMSHGMKRLVHLLRPAQLDELGLLPALEFLIDQAEKDFGLTVKLETRGVMHKSEPLIETVLFRIAQESLVNVARHARTKQAHLLLVQTGDGIELTFSDDGIGFDPSAIETFADRMGLMSMQERVEGIGGRFAVESSPGNGTIISVHVPVNLEPIGEDA